MVCKIAPKNSAPPNRGGNNGDADTSAPAQEIADYETALDNAGYGRFSRSVVCACACAFFSTGVENCVMSYVLPAARCELNLTTYHAGLINMAFMSGGTASAFFWGIVGDVFGRRNTLTLTLLANALITLVQSIFTDYRMLLAARCINGFLIGGPSTLVFTYLSDLVGVKRRQLYLNITGMSFVAAWLILPAYAWVVIPFKLSYETILPIQSWRLYLVLSSIPSFTAGFWILCLPESPRLLSDTNRNDEALDVLRRIHKSNRGDKEVYKIKKLIQDNIFVTKNMDEEQSRTKALFLGVMRDLKMLVSKAYAIKSSLILFAFFTNMAAGFGLNMWIPELLLRMQGRDCSGSVLAESAKLMLNDTNTVTYPTFTEYYLDGNATLSEPIKMSEECHSDIDNEVFSWGLIVGACCLMGNIACTLLVARGGAIGVRRAASACTLACALACACLAASACSCSQANKTAVAAAAVLNAASLNGNVLLIRLLLFALPPKLSGLGVCWGAWWGRAGGMASNIAVGALLDFSCPAPFVAVGALLALSIVAIMLIKLNPVEESEPEAKIEENTEKPSGMDKYISTHM